MSRISKFFITVSILVTLSACTSITPLEEYSVSEKAKYSHDENYYFSNVKYAPFDPNANQSLSGVAGKFIYEDECLVFIEDLGFRATPILPFGVTEWDEESQILHVQGKKIEMGQHISSNGGTVKLEQPRKGTCWEEYVMGFGTMGLDIK